MRRLYIAGNWKMNTTAESGASLAQALVDSITAELPAVDVLICPPFPYLSAIAAITQGSGVGVGAQNVYFESPGAFTGEVSVDMLQDIGCRSVILGHSERRHVLGETDELINRKVHAALAGGLQVILCVGELLADRQAGRTEAVLDQQMQGGLAGVDASQLDNLVIAYEPVWAIGTGVVASVEQAESAHAHLRNWLTNCYNDQMAESIRIQYGGSVKPDNAKALLEQPNVDGALVGGASLNADSFLGIINAAVAVAS